MSDETVEFGEPCALRFYLPEHADADEEEYIAYVVYPSIEFPVVDTMAGLSVHSTDDSYYGGVTIESPSWLFHDILVAAVFPTTAIDDADDLDNALDLLPPHERHFVRVCNNLYLNEEWDDPPTELVDVMNVALDASEFDTMEDTTQ